MVCVNLAKRLEVKLKKLTKLPSRMRTLTVQLSMLRTLLTKDAQGLRKNAGNPASRRQLAFD